MRYRLRTLLIVVPIFALLACVIGSGRSGSKQVDEIDGILLATLDELSPEVCEHFDVDYLMVDPDDYTCSFYTKDRHVVPKGLLAGPHDIQRLLHIGDQMAVLVKIQSPWYYICCGKPVIAIHASQSRGDQWLAKRLKAELLANKLLRSKVSICLLDPI